MAPNIPRSLRTAVRFWLWLSGLVGLCLTAWAANLVPVPLRAAIIVRSAGYERTFAERPGDAVLAVVTGKSGVSADDGREMTAVLGKLIGDGRIAGRKIQIKTFEYQAGANTLEALKSANVEIVYVAKGLEDILGTIPLQEGKVGRIIVCASGADVALGCTLGVELDGNKPQLVLNLKQATAAGLRFDPTFLRLARIVR